MNSVVSSVVDVLLPMKDQLIDAGALLQRTPRDHIGDAVGELDLVLRAAYRGAEGARRLLVLHREPEYDAYNPVEILRQHSGELGLTHGTPGSVKAFRLLHGDAEMVLECIRLFRDGIPLKQGARLHTSIDAGDATPRVVLRLEGPGTLPEELHCGGGYRMSIDAFGERWTAATAGGHIGLNPDGAVFYLQGDRPIPPSVAGLGPMLAPVRLLARRLQSWRGAIGHFEPGLVSEEEAQFVYRDTVARALHLIEEAAGPHLRGARPVG